MLSAGTPWPAGQPLDECHPGRMSRAVRPTGTATFLPVKRNSRCKGGMNAIRTGPVRVTRGCATRIGWSASTFVQLRRQSIEVAATPRILGEHVELPYASLNNYYGF
jgi:hypothetical protein